ncbi:protein trichome berefringence-like 7 [Apium graveolens]|uniref:protein trichome berefringence-like 7 n=1 Tax=Apium graveolens TaxID=4045 RepID=UPI003D79ECCC
MGKLQLSLFDYFRPSPLRIFGLGNSIAGIHIKSWVSQTFNGLIFVCTFVFLVLAMNYGYSCMVLDVQPVVRNYEIYNVTAPRQECNYFDGSWVYDERYPLYNASDCPFAERGFNCLANGRKDKDYQKWRWKPKNCDILKFNVHVVLEMLRGKRVVFVGDSLGRTQWESMICLLMTGVEDKSSVYEINGKKITKQIRHLGVRFASYNLIVEFYRSVFLVQPGAVPKQSPKRVKSTLKLDVLDNISKKWIQSDILIFNSGHWWTPGKLFDMRCYFQIDGRLKLGMSTASAYNTALTTWSSWVQNMIDTNRTRVFFRTFEPSHWSGSKHLTCKVTRFPLNTTDGKERNPFSDTIIKVVKNMTVPVTVMHVTPMGASRSDAHVGTWSDNPLVPDCSHWCLPGVPDAWNEILFSRLLSQD